MTEQQAKRKLTAILSADVKGYSRLMEDDEEATVRTITAYREVMVEHITRQNGRVADAKGDNILAEFASVVDAVRCGVEIQKELGKRNGELPENRRMEFRIGINLGDVIEEKETIYGDGVNIAARLEALADGGGICISGTAFDQIGKRLSVGYEYLGEKSVKNIEKPVRAYRVVMEPEYAGEVIGEKKPKQKQWRWVAAPIVLIVVIGALAVWNLYFRPPSIEPASVEKMAFPLPEKPSIAVLPFVNMSGDPEQEYFSDGLTEEIITALSKVPKVFVIARNSTFSYKGKAVKVNQVAEELGVRYVLEGSVRKSGDKVRVTAQLVDAATGNHLWAERYDREMKDIFIVQDEITMKIITELQVKLTEGEQSKLIRKGTENLEAYLKCLKAREYINRMNEESNAIGKQILQEVIALDPEYAVAYMLLAVSHFMDVWYGSTTSPKQSLARSAELAKKTIALDDSSAVAFAHLGRLDIMERQYEKGIAKLEKAVTVNSNSANAHAFLAYGLWYAGRHEEAIKWYKKAIRLNPMPPNWYLVFLGHAYRHAGKYEEAMSEYMKALQRYPDDLWAHTGLTVLYILLGREEEARSEAAEVLRINPKFSVGHIAKTLPFKNQADKDLVIEALRKAGLK